MKNLLKAFIAGAFLFSSAHADYLTFDGLGPWVPRYLTGVNVSGNLSPTILDATGEKIAFCGKVVFAGRSGNFTIDKVGFSFGTLTKTGGSGLRVSLQDVSPTGPPTQPDGTEDQFIDIANADSEFASSNFYTTGSLSAGRTVAYRDFVCTVIGFDASGKQGSDVIRINAITLASGVNRQSYNVAVTSLSVPAPWTILALSPNVVFENSSGEIAWFEESYPLELGFTHTYNSGSTPDERALSFWNPFNIKIDMLWAAYSPSATSAGSINLYEGTTLIESVGISTYTIPTAGAAMYVMAPIPIRTLTAHTTYYVSIAPGSTNATAYSISFSKPEYAKVMYGGPSHGYTARTDGGAWDIPVSTQTLIAGYRINAIDIGSGGGGTRGYPFFQ